MEGGKNLLYRGQRARDDDGDTGTGRRWFDAAYRAADEAGDATALAEAALGLAGLWIREQRHTLLPLRLRRALAAVEPESPLGLRVRLRLAAEAAHDAASLLSLAALAWHSTDPVARAEAANLTLQCLVGPDHTALRHSLAEQLITDGVWHGRRGDVFLGLMWRAVNLLRDGDTDAERYLHELRAMLARHNHLAVGAVVDGIDVMRHIRAGELEAAEARANANARWGRLNGTASADGRHALHLVAIRWYQGRIGELAPMLRDHAYLSGFAHDEPQAHHALARLTRSNNWLVGLYGVVEAARLRHDRSTAAEAYRLLLPYADRPAVGDLGAVCFGSVQHPLGQAALIQGDADRAVAHLTAAVHANAVLGHWPAVVLARTRLAEALERWNETGDVEWAARERQAASRDAADIGLPLPGPVSPPSTTERRRQPAAATCRRVEQHWEITVGDHRARIGPMRGMAYLAILLANPGQEMRAAELAAGPGRNRAERPAGRLVVDDETRPELRHRLAQLAEQIATYEFNDELDKADELRGERDWLIADLATATGLAAGSRTAPSNDERARIAVGKAIRRTIDRITRVNPLVGHHLQNTVHTGARCSYRPMPIELAV